MCDYSLHHVASAPAKVGDELVTTTFPMSSTRGFARISEPNVVVCLKPGTELAFASDVECDRAFSFLPRRKYPARVARFRQVNMHNPMAYHDVLEFPDGSQVFLTHLAPGQRAKVLQLPVEPAATRIGPAEEPGRKPVTATHGA